METFDLGARIRTARVAAHLSQEQLANTIGIPSSIIFAIESGDRNASATELIDISQQLRQPLEYFIGESGGAFRETLFAVRFRTLDLQPIDEATVFEFETSCRDFRWLEDALNVRQPGGPHLYEWPHPTTTHEAAAQGEALAIEERNRLALGIDPVADPFDVVESQGIRIFVRTLDTPHVSGIVHHDDDVGACILVNSGFHRNRRAFDLLHEYAHLLLDHASGAHRTDDSQRTKKPIECRADAFAAAFLMPRDGIAAYFDSRGIQPTNSLLESIEWSDVCRVMVTFGASYRATVYRLQELGYLNPRVAQQYRTIPNIAELTDRFRKAAGIEAPNFDDPRIRRFGQLVLRAYGKALISISRVAEMLAMDIDQAREFVWGTRLELSGKSESPR